MSQPAYQTADLRGAATHDSVWTRYLFSTDHKIIGFQYLFTGMFMALIGAICSLILLSRWQNRQIRHLPRQW